MTTDTEIDIPTYKSRFFLLLQIAFAPLWKVHYVMKKGQKVLLLEILILNVSGILIE